LQSPDVAVSTLNLTASVAAAVAGQAVTFTAALTPLLPAATSATPQGQVIFTVDGIDRPAIMVNGAGKATLSFARGLSVGTHTVTARYVPGNKFTASLSQVVTLAVRNAATTTRVTSSAAGEVPASRQVTFTATVRGQAPGSGTPSRVVDFFDNGLFIGRVLLNALSQARLTLRLSAGLHTIVAIYRGDDEFTRSWGQVAQRVIAG
jgi:hypothetical protein